MNDSREADLPTTVETTGTLVSRYERGVDDNILNMENVTNIENVAPLDLLETVDFEALPIDLSKQTLEASPTELVVDLAKIDITKINCAVTSSTKPINHHGNDLSKVDGDNEGNKSCELGKKRKCTAVSEASPSKVIKLDNGPPVVFMPKNNVDPKINYQRQLDFLSQVFPDADPNFLKEKSTLNETDLKVFISETIGKKNYPRTQLKNGQIELGLYTSDFSVERFIQIFPDPFQYFTSKKRLCHSNPHAFEFMKRRYRNHCVKLITVKYKDMGYNLTKTCDVLDSSEPSRSAKRGLYEIDMPEEENIPFLQEICFIEHKDEIKNYIDTIEEGKNLAYWQAEERGELVECGCCYGQVIFEDCAACNDGDVFCKTCIQKSIEVRIGYGHITFPCLSDCGSEFSLQLLQNLLNAGVFSKLLQRIQLAEVKAADIEGLEICPFCEFATIPLSETKVFTCLNPDCLKESCRHCHKASHIPLRCEEVENDDQARARKFIEDEMTRALVRECYRCKRRFIKSYGCNIMTCTCGARMCYICREPVNDYNHFNGPGGSKSSNCPLHSTDKVLHVDAVIAVAEEALQTVTTENPELKLKHDPTKLLPEQPAASVLPPGGNGIRQGLVVNRQRVRKRRRRY